MIYLEAAVSFWKPFLNQFARSLSSSRRRNFSPNDGTTRRSFKARIEPLEVRTLLTSVTGDFNGDGIADVAIGMPSQTVNGLSNAGQVQILYGSQRTSSSGNPGLNGLTTVNNLLISQATSGLKSAAQANAQFGASLTVGDFNRDGVMDLAIGTPGENVNGVTGAGAVFILFGSKVGGLKTTGVQMITEKSLNRPAAAGDHFGSALAAGDFNNDRFIDLAVGIPNKKAGSFANAGAVSVIYGAFGGLSPANNQVWDQTLLKAGTVGAGDKFGSSLAVGDFNADGFRDLAVGAPGQTVGGNANAGAVNVIYGHATALNQLNNQFWTAGANGVLGNSNAGAQFGFSLATGDFNDDIRSDLVIGAPGEDIVAVGSAAAVSNAGAVHVLMGSSARLTSTNNQLWNENNTGITGSAAASGNGFGAAVASGLMNSDRLGDLAIGVPGATVSGNSGAGSVTVLYGAAASTTQRFAGLGTVNAQSWDQSMLTSTGDSPAANELFGSSVAIGDFNGDHIGDLVSETPGESHNNNQPGSASIIFGTSSGLNAGGTGTAETTQVWIPTFKQIFPDPTREQQFNNPITAAQNLKNGNAFLAANKTKPGVITTADGLQYKIISNPTPNAAAPTDSSTVHVIYTGTLLNGTVFDASSQHPDSGTTNQSTFPVTMVVPGFAEMLKLMHVGEHVTVYIPSNLAYGTQGNSPTIPPNSVIIFDLTLVSNS